MNKKTDKTKWKKVILSDVCEIVMGQSPPSKSYNESGEGLPLVQGNTELEKRKIVTTRYTSQPKKIGKVGDIIITVRAPVGELAITDKEIALGRGVAAIRVLDENTTVKQYVMASLMKSVSVLEKQSQGSTFNAIKSTDLKEFELYLPPLDEQRRIADILGAIDQDIAATSSIIATSEELKQGMMQELFEKGNKKLYQIEDICNVEIGGTPARKKSAYWDSKKEGGNVWVSIADLTQNNGTYISDSKEYITGLGIEKSNVKVVPKGTVMMSFKLTVGTMAIAGKDLYTNEAIAAFHIKDTKQVLPEYLYALLPTLEYDTDTAIKGKTLNKSKINNAYISLPPLDEQRRIADIVGAIDKKIEKEKKVLEQLNTLKQGVMIDLLS